MTAMQTKLRVLNPLCPVFALSVAGLLDTGLFATGRSAPFVRSSPWRRQALGSRYARVGGRETSCSAARAEPGSRRIHAGTSDERPAVNRGHAYFASRGHATTFSLRGFSHATPAMAIDVTSFLKSPRMTIFYRLTQPSIIRARLVLSNGRHALFRRQTHGFPDLHCAHAPGLPSAPRSPCRRRSSCR